MTGSRALEIGGLTAAVVDVEAYAMENACALVLGGRGEDHSGPDRRHRRYGRGHHEPARPP